MYSQLRRVALAAAAWAAFGLAAQASPLVAASRADGAALWDAEANPALLGCMASRGMRLDAAYGLGPSAPAYIGMATPFGSYLGFSSAGSAYGISFGSGFSFGQGLALGYRLGWSSAKEGISSFAAGMVVRPANFISLGITGVSETGVAELGMGLGLRPLALLGLDGRALTLTADAGFDRNLTFAMESVGVRLSLGGLLELGGWYEFPATSSDAGSFGASLLVSLGPAGLGIAAPSVARLPASGYAGLNALAKISLGAPGKQGAGKMDGPDFAPPFAKKVLLLKGIDHISPAPDPGAPFTFSFDDRSSLSFPGLFAALNRAAADPSVAAVAIEKLPQLSGAAAYQELDSSLAALKAAGKRIYIYGEAFGNELAWLSARAESVSLNPNGSAGLTGLGYRRTYLKPLFDSLGVSFVNLAPWKTKSAYNSYTSDSMPPEERDMMGRFYGDIQAQVEAALALGRGPKLPAGAKAALAGGPYLSATEALKAGLVDSLAYADEFEAAVRKANPGAAFVASVGEKDEGSWGEPAFAKRVAVVWLEGSIGIGKGVAGASIGSLAAESIAELRKDGSVAAIVLRVDSPGGAVLTSDAIAREVRLAVEAGKPVVVSMGSYAASGGYYVSANASRIFAEPATVTGSIGVTGLIPNFSGTLAKLGIKYDGLDVSPNASFADPLKPADPAEGARLNAWILDTYGRFVDVVAKGRRMDRAKVMEIGEGRIWSGREAVSIGLVDELGGLEDAKAYVARKLGKAVFFDVMPGEAPSLFDGLGLSSLAAGKGVSKVLEPLEAKLDSLAELGSGPLFYLDMESF
jgi:protease-4